MPAILILAIMTTPLIVAWVFSTVKIRQITDDNPNIGTLVPIRDTHLNLLHIPASESADLPPLLFIHGASGNLRDQAEAFRPALEGRADLIFVDRPGHGYSPRGGPENDTPDGQANAIAEAMDALGLSRAIIIGHSFGGAIAASFAVLHPEKTAGLLFLAPATHPWPGGVDWHYHLTATPIIGPLFARTLAPLAGLAKMDGAIGAVFAPNPRPDDYIARTAPTLVLRPSTFRHNAIDVCGLHTYVTRMAPRYLEIQAPTVIVTGDRDAIVLADIHSIGLARDIAGAELIWVRHLGHKPDYCATDLAVAAIEKIAGQDRNLPSLASKIGEALEMSTN
ncbi:alpha/beta fold hydrolase [Agrobacterium vitis]